MPVPDSELTRRPTVCPRGHPLGPGQYSLSWAWCGDCSTNGHHWIICGTCKARLWLGHTADWDLT